MYTGVIIEESLENEDILKKIKIVSTEIEQVTENFKTPWLTQWTLDTVEIPESEIEAVAQEVQSAIDSVHNTSWYVDFKNDSTHYIIFKNRIFVIDRTKREQYQEASDYGVSLGVPAHQVNFVINTI